MSGLKTRVLTAAVFVLIMLIGIISGPYTYLLLFGTINFLCLWEFFGLVLGKNRRESLIRNVLALIMGMGPFIFSAFLELGMLSARPQLLLNAAIIYTLVFYSMFVLELFMTSSRALQYLAYVVLGIIYIGTSFAILNSLAFSAGEYQMQLVLGIVLLVWVNDTAAYLVGSRLGKHPLFPRISPKKTWEGSLGAVFFTLLIAFPVSVVLPVFPYPIWLVIALIIFVTGGIGDLVESLFKRSIEIKDSSGLLPGHGGFLDRFDAFVFSVPFVAAFLFFFEIIQ